jgi:hypothetical protein
MKLKEATWGGGFDITLPEGPWPLTDITPLWNCGRVDILVDNDDGISGEDTQGLWLTMSPDEARRFAVQLWHLAQLTAIHDETTCPACTFDKELNARLQSSRP